MSIKSLVTIIFLSVLLIFGITSLLSLNNPELSTPHKELSISTIKSGEFLNDIEKKINDNFFLNSIFVNLKSNIDNISGRIEYNDIYVTDEGLFLNPMIKNQSILDNNIKAINEFSKKYSENSNIKMMIVPTSIEFAKKHLPKYINSTDQNKIIKDIYQQTPLIGSIDSYYAFSSVYYNSAFYKTHKSWTSLGAYYGYTALSRSLGYRPTPIDFFNIEHISYDFTGNLAEKANTHTKLKDTIDIYYYSVGDNINQLTIDIDENQNAVSSMFFKEYVTEQYKNKVFLGEPTNIITIDTVSQNNKNLLIFKDELANPLMQFLSIHFQQITLVDLDFFNQDMLDSIDVNEYQQVLFLYDFDNFVNNEKIGNIINF